MVAAATPTAVAIGNITGYGISDVGIIVGPSSGRTSSAYLWDGNLKLLGSGGFPWSIAGDGQTVGGKNSAGLPVVWTFSGTWTEHVIPDVGFGGAVRAIASNASGSPIGMTGNVWTNGTNKTPARWTPCDVTPSCPSGWQLSTSGQALSINRSGPNYRIVGEVNGAGAYWTNF